jgi:threonine/homoserine/homoserine lactone efflux protein
MDNKELLGLLVQGIVLGFSIAAPVGPIGVLCIRRTLQNGFKSGLASGLGAASADAVYGAIAAAGLTLAADFLALAKQQIWLGILGGAFLLFLGVRTFLSPPPEADGQEPQTNKLGGDYLSTFLLTLSNPITIFSFAAMFGGLNAGSGAGFRTGAFVLVLGVFSGSALWWLSLSMGVSFFRNTFSRGVMRWVNRTAGAVIVVFGLMMLWRALAPLID